MKKIKDAFFWPEMKGIYVNIPRPDGREDTLRYDPEIHEPIDTNEACKLALAKAQQEVHNGGER